MTQLRSERNSNQRSQSQRSTQIARYHNSRNQRPKKAKYQDRITLPKFFTFICVPDNGNEGPPQMPRKSGFDPIIYNAMHRQKMILNIRFDRGEHDYCLQRVLQSFASLPLLEFQFYRGSG